MDSEGQLDDGRGVAVDLRHGVGETHAVNHVVEVVVDVSHALGCKPMANVAASVAMTFKGRAMA